MDGENLRLDRDELGIVSKLRAQRMPYIKTATPEDAFASEILRLSTANNALREELKRRKEQIERLQEQLAMAADLRDRNNPSYRLPVSDILRVAAVVAGTEVSLLKSHRQTKLLIWARHFSIWLLSEIRTDLSLPRIAAIMGGRDHTSILHALRKHRERRDLSPVAQWVRDPRVLGIMPKAK